MENKAAMACVIVAVVGILSAAAGFAAEATRVKASDIYILDDAECVYPSSPALGLGVAAAVLAVVTRIVIGVFTGGCNCCRNDPNSSPLSRLLFIFSWIASVIAVVLLLVAAGLNNRQGGQVDTYGGFVCYVVKPGVFAAGAALSLASALLGIAAFLTLNSTKQANLTAANIPMGTPPVATNYNVDLEKRPIPHQQF